MIENSLKCFYSQPITSRIVILYDFILIPEYFQIFFFGQYLDQSLLTLKFLSECKAVIGNNETYINTTLKAVEVYNSSLLT